MGDYTITVTPGTVQAIQGVAVSSTAPADGQVLTYVNADGKWEPVTPPSSLPPSGSAGGDLGGTYPNPSVLKINGASVPAAGSLTTGNVLQVNGSSALTYAAINLAGGSNYVTGALPTANQVAQNLTLTGDVTSSGGTTASASTTVTAISGSSPIAIAPANLQWAASTAAPKLSQADNITNSATAANLTIQAQNATGTHSIGGDLILRSGNGTDSDGYITLETGQVQCLTVNPNGVVQLNNLSTGVIHADSSGNLTSSLIVNADVSASAAIAYSKLNLSGSIVNADISTSAAIAVSKLAAGSSAQILLNNSTPTPTWTTVGGDATISSTGSVINTGLQGNAVKSGTPTDGQVLTWVNADSKWEAVTPTVTGLRKTSFTSSGTWTCPTGVTNILVIAAGGGGGGSGGGGGYFASNGGYSGGGGGASIQQTSYVTVSPGTSYTITIGAGGSGGSGGGSFGGSGNDGNPTKISNGATVLFSVLAGGGAGDGNAGGKAWLSGTPFSNNQTNNGLQYANATLFILPGSGGYGGPGVNSGGPQSGMVNYVGGYSGGSVGTNVAGQTLGGGAGGGAGPQGAGGNGGNASTGGAGSNGANAANNTGAGGGGGGTGNNNGNGGNGGNGGSGYLYIVY